jgi:hypothetical protein
MDRRFVQGTYWRVTSAWRGVFSLESPTRMTNLPGSMVHLWAASLPVAEGAGVEVEGDVAGFAGGEADFFKSLQFALGAGGFGGWVGDVELRDFCSGDAARCW